MYVFTTPVVDARLADLPFAWTEVLLREINDDSSRLVLHIWPMEKTIILGMLDTSLPYLEMGQSIIKTYGYEYVVRKIGGRAVVADDGVLNISLFIFHLSYSHLL